MLDYLNLNFKHKLSGVTMDNILKTFQKNRTQTITMAALVLLFVMALRGMTTEDWVITLLRSLAVGSVTFLVAAGFSLIFGLMDVLNLAHGTLFMIGAYVGWTVFVRPDTFLDVSTPAGLVGGGLALVPVWAYLLKQQRWFRGFAANPAQPTLQRYWPWAGLVLGGLILAWGLPKYPITIWDPGVFSQSPGTYALGAAQGTLILPEPKLFEMNPYLVLGAILLGSLIGGAALAGFTIRSGSGHPGVKRFPRGVAIGAGALLLFGLGTFFFHGALTGFLVSINNTWLFLLAVVVAVGVGFGLGAMMESALIRPLYSRPIYQILMTLGVSAVGIEIVRVIWGRPEFTMPKPVIFDGAGEGCPATSLANLIAYQCSTVELLGSRVRTYNEIFVPLLGVVVLVAIWLLLQRTRLGMIIRAGVQDSEMVEALGINVRWVFTMVFALGVGLAALGGVIAGPSMGLALAMGESLLINALIALAIGGLTSFPGAAAGSLMVGIIQQFMIKYGQLGINIPFLAEPFKPTPPLVPASTVLLMVIVLLVLPNGLFGKKE
ncbi:MAG: branched-chain amino acid ABC transporter permease [Anaerolineales bacterium]